MVESLTMLMLSASANVLSKGGILKDVDSNTGRGCNARILMPSALNLHLYRPLLIGTFNRIPPFKAIDTRLFDQVTPTSITGKQTLRKFGQEVAIVFDLGDMIYQHKLECPLTKMSNNTPIDLKR